MPTICKKDTCRNKAVYGFCFRKPLFCSLHREPESKNTSCKAWFDKEKEEEEKKEETIPTCVNCSGKTGLMPRFKGFCSHCYVTLYPTDALTLQTLYKSKNVVIQKFIDSKFDGFVHKNGLSEIQISGTLLQIIYNTGASTRDEKKNIVIKFNPNKYANGKNPMLYTRLPMLEKEIARQFERIMGGLPNENSEL